MATATLTKPAAKGGSFLLESPQPSDVFTPADLSDDQKLIGQTAKLEFKEQDATGQWIPATGNLNGQQIDLLGVCYRHR